MKAILKQLNGLSFKPGKERKLGRADLLDVEQAFDASGKKSLQDRKLWSADAVFVKVKTMVELYGRLDDEGRESLCHDEILGGWFGAGPADDVQDHDGEFCSTPCHDDDAPAKASFKEDLDYVSANGVLFFY